MMPKHLVKTIADVDALDVPRSPGVTIQVVLGPGEAMPTFYMRVFTMAPGASIPAHSHDVVEHEQVVLEGAMHITADGVERLAGTGDVIFFPPGCVHSYENRGDVPVRFLCVVPATEDYSVDWVEDAPVEHLGPSC